VIAAALVAAAERPKAEFTIGLEARLIEWIFGFSRPVGDLVLRVVDLYYGSGNNPAADPGGLWQPSGEGAASGGHHGRPSLWGLLRGRGRPRSSHR
jgi:hypothetical protein